MNVKMEKDTLSLTFENFAKMLEGAVKSKTGKSNIVYTTSGFMPLPVQHKGKPVRISINLIAAD